MRRKRTTAAELMARLEADPEYRRRRDLLEAERASEDDKLRQDEGGLVAEVRALGYDIDSVWDLVNNNPHLIIPRRFVGPYERAYATLVRHLDVSHHPRIREGVIRALTVKDGGQLVQEALYEQFEHELDEGLRWVLANALRVAMPYRVRRTHPKIAEAYRLGGATQAG